MHVINWLIAPAVVRINQAIGDHHHGRPSAITGLSMEQEALINSLGENRDNYV